MSDKLLLEYPNQDGLRKEEERHDPPHPVSSSHFAHLFNLLVGCPNFSARCVHIRVNIPDHLILPFQLNSDRRRGHILLSSDTDHPIKLAIDMSDRPRRKKPPGRKLRQFVFSASLGAEKVTGSVVPEIDCPIGSESQSFSTRKRPIRS
jgi:hypothetical protein